MLSSNIVNFILKITSVSLMLSLLIFLIPENKNKNLVCIVFSIIFMLFFLSPIKNLLSKNINIFDTTIEIDISTQNNVLDYSENKIKSVKIEGIKEYLNNNSYNYKNIDVDFSIEKYQIEKIIIYFDKLELNNYEEHKNIIVKIKEDLSMNYNIEEKNIIIIYE